MEYSSLVQGGVRTKASQIVPSDGAVVFSIRPAYAALILAGRKTIELRRRFSREAKPGLTVLVYSTAPVQAIVGVARLEAASERDLESLWAEFGDEAAISKPNFDEYFRGAASGWALKLSDPRAFERPIPLRKLSRNFEFSPPQSYCYWKEPLPKLVTHGRVKITS